MIPLLISWHHFDINMKSVVQTFTEDFCQSFEIRKWILYLTTNTEDIQNLIMKKKIVTIQRQKGKGQVGSTVPKIWCDKDTVLQIGFSANNFKCTLVCHGITLEQG